MDRLAPERRCAVPTWTLAGDKAYPAGHRRPRGRFPSGRELPERASLPAAVLPVLSWSSHRTRDLRRGRWPHDPGFRKNMGGESEAAWRTLLDDLVKRGLKGRELVIVDGAPGIEKARFTNIATSSPMRRSGCTTNYRRTTRI